MTAHSIYLLHPFHHFLTIEATVKIVSTFSKSSSGLLMHGYLQTHSIYTVQEE